MVPCVGLLVCSMKDLGGVMKGRVFVRPRNLWQCRVDFDTLSFVISIMYISVVLLLSLSVTPKGNSQACVSPPWLGGEGRLLARVRKASKWNV